MPHRKPLHVLLVEDSEGDALLLGELLGQDARITFDRRARLEEAIGQAAAARYDVALLDLHLPDSQGLATFEAFHRARPQVPTIVLTGLKGDETARAALRAGATDYLAKTDLNGETLARTLRFAVERAEHRHDILQYKRYLDAVGQGVVAIDAQGVVRYWNQGATDLYGWAAGEALGKPVRDLRLSELPRPVADRIVAATMAGEPWAGEVTGRRKDGTTFPAYCVNTPTRDADGRIQGVIGVSHDMTPFHQLEARLREAAQQARTAQEMAGLFSWSVDLRTGDASWDDAAYAGLGYDPATARRSLEQGLSLVMEEERPRLVAWLESLRESPTLFDGEVRLRHADGGVRVVRAIARPVLDDAGRTVGIMGVAQDLTEQREREAEVERVRRSQVEQERLAALGTLVAGVAHEINNPLSYVQGGAELAKLTMQELLEEEAFPPAARAKLDDIAIHLDQVLRGVGAIGSITRALRQLSRAPNGTRREEDLCQTIESVMAVAASRVPPNVDIVPSLPASAMAVVNAGEVSQVLLNLLINAGDAIGDRGGRVQVRLTEARDHVLIEVEDDGAGIPPHVAAQLFTPFFTTKPEGTGLGLSLSRRIVEDHGGTLTFETRPGEGTTFRLKLSRVPLAAPPPAVHW